MKIMNPNRRPLVMRFIYGAVFINLLFYTFTLTYLHNSRARHERQAATTTQNLAKTLEIYYAGRLNKIDVSLNAVAMEAERQIASGKTDKPALVEYLARQLSATPELDGIWLADSKGDLRYGTGIQSGKPINISDREYFIRQAQGHAPSLVVSKPVMGRITKEWSILLSRRINNPDGSFAGMALGSLPFVKDFSSIFATLDVGPNGSLSIRDGDNGLMLILRYTPKKGVSEVGSTRVPSEISKRILDNPTAATYTVVASVDGVERLFTHRKIGKYPWYILVGISTDDYLAPWRKEAAVLLSLLAVFTLTTILFTRSVLIGTKETISKELAQERSDKLEALLREQAAQLEMEKLVADAAQQQQKAAEVLADSRNLLDSIINSTPDMIWSVEPETYRLVAFNRGMAKYFFKTFGYHLETGLRPADLLHVEELSKKWEGYYRRAIEQGAYRTEYVSHAGGVFLDLNFNPIKREGILTGISVFARDITEQKKTEEQLRKLNRELVAISNCNQILVRAADKQALLDDICRVVCEQAGYRMAWVGYAEHDADRTVRPVATAGLVDGYLADATISWADTESGQGPTGTAIRRGETVYTQDFSVDPRMESWRSQALQCGFRSSIALPLMDANGTAFGALTIYSDEANAFTQEEIRLLEELADDLAFGITVMRVREEHKQLEERLHHSQKMESIGRLAGGVAHDFNNMLSVILGAVQLSSLPNVTEAAHRQNLEMIQKAAERSRDITRQLLAFSRKEVISPKPMDLNAHIIAAEKNLGRLIGEDVQLTFRPGTGLWTVLIDPAQLDQILMNLSVNARDAMPDGGGLTIETVNVSIEGAQSHYLSDAAPGDYIRITVSDTGHGMDRETQEHIFEPFFTTKEAGRGTGLGLATVYGIVTQNNGFINCYSEPGQGTVFRIYLPRHSKAPALPEEVTDRAVPTGTGTILLVEDEEILLWMTMKMLEEMGYAVILAETPEAAIAICERQEQHIDLVLTDVVMPKMNGREMAERIRILRPDIRVLFMSGYTADIVAQRGIVEQGMYYIQKPFGMQQLNEKIREAMA